MKLELQTNKLKEVIHLIERVAGKHVTLPVLSCVLIEVGKNTATFKATNLDVGVEIVLSVKSEGTGMIAVPAHTLSSFVSQLPEQSAITSIELESGNIHIHTPQSDGIIKTVPVDDFPSIPRVTDGQNFNLPTEVLIKGLKAVWYSASVSSIKPELSSVYMYREGDNLVCAATDSFRLAEKKIRIPATAKLDDVLIPFKNIPEIIRLLETLGGEVEVNLSKNLISFTKEGVYVVSRVIDGVFPDYHQIIPKGYMTEAIALKQDIINALKLSNIFSDKFNQVHLVIDPKKKVFEVQTKNSDVGENKTSISGALTGERIEVNFNYKYIVDCFQSIDADSVSLQLSGLNRPMVIRPVSGDQTFMYIVMPMNR